jgi:hypothetical protein
MAALAEVRRDQSVRMCVLWHSMALLYAATYIVIGAGYAIAGDGVVQGSASIVIRHTYGMRVHGLVMMVLGGLLLVGLPYAGRRTNRCLMLCAAYAGYVFVVMWMSVWITHHWVWGGPWFYCMLATSCAILRAHPPAVVGSWRGESGRGWRA